jgi:hypothetical protein
LIGLALAGLALVFPYYLAPLIWGSFTLIVDPWNYRRGARSLLRDFEEGDLGLIGRLLLAGLICGVVWESLNFFAPQKWIYTVRGLEGFKVFEMPLLGFLGFPALALDSMAAYALGSSLLQGNRTWEHPDDLSYQPAIHPPRSAGLFTLTAGLQVLFWGAVSIFATPINVASLQVELADLELNRNEIHLLNQRGITRPRQFLIATDTEPKRGDMRTLLGWDERQLQRVRRRAALYTFKGIGRDHGRMLERAGVQAPEHLAGWDAEELLGELMAIQPPLLVAPPRHDFVKVWILAARGHSIVQVSR